MNKIKLANKIALYVNTAKYMTASQCFYRLLDLGKKACHKRRAPIVKIKVEKLQRFSGMYADYVPRMVNLKKAEKICDNTIPTISGIDINFGGNIDWDMNDIAYRLPRFRVNSFRYLLVLSDSYLLSGDRRYLEYGFFLINDWMKKNGKFIQGDKWNAYVIADRLFHWIGFVSAYANDKQIAKIAVSIASQAAVLKNDLEFHLGANHLLSEAKTLLYVGFFLDERNTYEFALKLLVNEFKNQFFSDGGHYERSVSYHVEALQQYFETVALMHKTRDKRYVDLVKKIIPAYKFLNEMVGPDGHIPLVNDAADDYPFTPKDFLATSQYLYQTEAFRAESGYYTEHWRKCFSAAILYPIEWERANHIFYQTGFVCSRFMNKQGMEEMFFFDAGDNGPNENLGHAHADALSVLWTVGDKRILVDSGVFTYCPGNLRQNCRSTAAHNTVELDSTNSAEIWAAFRVARRGHTIIEKLEDNEKVLVCTAMHDGYAKILEQGLLHRRTVYSFKNECVHVIIDELCAKKNEHIACWHYYFSPECKVILLDKYHAWIDETVQCYCTECLELQAVPVAMKFGVIQNGSALTGSFRFSKRKIMITAFSSLMDLDLEAFIRNSVL